MRKSDKFLLIISHQIFYSPGHLQCSEPEYDTCTPLEAVASQVSRVQSSPGSSNQSRVQYLVQGLISSPGSSVQSRVQLLVQGLVTSPGSSNQSRANIQSTVQYLDQTIRPTKIFGFLRCLQVQKSWIAITLIQFCRPDKSSDNQIASLSSRQVISQWMLLLTSQWFKLQYW